MRNEIQLRAAFRAYQHLIDNNHLTTKEVEEACVREDRHVNISALNDVYVEYIWSLLQQRLTETDDPDEHLIIKRIGRVYQWLRTHVNGC